MTIKDLSPAPALVTYKWGKFENLGQGHVRAKVIWKSWLKINIFHVS